RLVQAAQRDVRGARVAHAVTETLTRSILHAVELPHDGADRTQRDVLLPLQVSQLPGVRHEVARHPATLLAALPGQRHGLSRRGHTARAGRSAWDRPALSGTPVPGERRPPDATPW